uniref:Protein SOK1 n=1 Tax=Lygus hesperus TaxID=30085 RepID=A0A0A9YXL1_LYGHE
MAYSTTSSNSSYSCDAAESYYQAVNVNGLISDAQYIEEVGVNAVCEEALNEEKSTISTLQKWPHVPTWKNKYAIYSLKKLPEIIQYNYSNVIDYVDREVLLTGKSVYEMPITIDYTCGGVVSIPAHATPPKREFVATLNGMNIGDI